MKIEFEVDGRKFQADTGQGRSLAINLDFDGPQPNHFGANKAKRDALELGGFVGSTSRGGSCNVDTIEMVPHCNGTHTETVSHIVDDLIYVGQTVPTHLLPAILITIRAETASQTGESYRPEIEEQDQFITSKALQTAIGELDKALVAGSNALIIRTLPNEDNKKTRKYSEQNEPAFFSVEAMQFINELKVDHLLVDLPSVDRMYDDGKLTNHHIFWNVAEESHQISADSWRGKTISEMLFVNDQLKDGFYLLNLQVPAFFTDAAPSRPIVFPVTQA